MVITRYRPSTVTLALAFWPCSAVAVTVTTVAFVTLGATSTQLFSILAIVPAVVAHLTSWEQVATGWTLVRNWNWAWLGRVTAVGTITTLQADTANKISNNIALPLFFYAASLRAKAPRVPYPPSAYSSSASMGAGRSARLASRTISSTSH